jgi:hypothetical protein
LAFITPTICNGDSAANACLNLSPACDITSHNLSLGSEKQYFALIYTIVIDIYRNFDNLTTCMQ